MRGLSPRTGHSVVRRGAAICLVSATLLASPGLSAPGAPVGEGGPIPALSQYAGADAPDGPAPCPFAAAYDGGEAEVGFSVKETPDGGYVLAGNTNSYGAGGLDFWVLKTDSLGRIEWQKTYGDTLCQVRICAMGAWQRQRSDERC